LRRLGALAVLLALAATAAPKTAGAETSTLLQLGSRGPAVLALNERLAQLRYLRDGQVTNVFTHGTFHAVVAFQKYSRLHRDGIVGPETRAALRTARRPQPLLAERGRRIEVWLARQLTFLVARGAVRRAVAVSTGRPGYETPSGRFSIYRRERRSWSGIYDVWLRWAAYFHPRGIAFHSYPRVPTRPASGGCVRVPPPFAREVYRFAQIGVRVVVR
jgi:lipoprotein-anchoring transpeptidase ErfK/SrfK